MAKKLTKELLQGSKITQTVTVTVNDEEAEIEVRPLSGPESAEVQAAMNDGNTMKNVPGRGGKMERRIETDLQQSVKGQTESNVLAVHYGTVEDFSKQEVEDLFDNKMLTDIATEIKYMSGLIGEKDIENFRASRRGDSDGSEDELHSDEGLEDTTERSAADESAAETDVHSPAQ